MKTRIITESEYWQLKTKANQNKQPFIPFKEKEHIQSLEKTIKILEIKLEREVKLWCEQEDKVRDLEKQLKEEKAKTWWNKLLGI